LNNNPLPNYPLPITHALRGAVVPEPKLTVTIDVFSGRPNPVVEFTGRKLQDALKRLDPGARAKPREAGLPRIPTLGYRGLEVELSGGAKVRGLPRSFRVADGLAIGPDFAVALGDEGFEDFICGTKLPDIPPLKPRLDEYRDLIDFWRRTGRARSSGRIGAVAGARRCTSPRSGTSRRSRVPTTATTTARTTAPTRTRSQAWARPASSTT
jgi:hypothetical protein